jgi:hypothetical protein
MRKWGRARQKLFEALYALAGPEPLRLRLTYAGDALTKLAPADFPVSSRQTFKELRALLTQTPPFVQLSLRGANNLTKESKARSHNNRRAIRKNFGRLIRGPGGLA